MMNYTTELTTHEALSGLFGSISLASWISVFIPQLLENYLSKSTESLSLAFLVIWTFSDFVALVGAIWAELVPIVIANGVYFAVADCLLLAQYLYYRAKPRQQEEGKPYQQPQIVREASNGEEIGEITVLLQQEVSKGVTTTLQDVDRNNVDIPTEIGEVVDTRPGVRVHSVVVILLIIAVGCTGWMAAFRLGIWQPASTNIRGTVPKKAVGAQILGYFGTVTSLAARIPQIIKNLNEKNCAGLAPLFFALSLVANISYGASILCHSLEPEYVIKSLPWLVGSLGTIPQDVIILAQIRFYEKLAKREQLVVQI